MALGLFLPPWNLVHHSVHGDNLSLSILIHVTRQQFNHYKKPMRRFSQILEVAAKFNVRDTSVELQQELCVLWNQMVRKMQNDDSWRTAYFISRPIHNVYITLHQDTNSAPTRLFPSTENDDDVLKRCLRIPCATLLAI